MQPLESLDDAGHRCEALGIDARAGELHMVVSILVVEVHRFVLEQVGFEVVSLLGNPGQRQTDREVNLCCGSVLEIKLPGNGRFAARSLIVPNTKSPLENILSFSRGQLLYYPTE